MKLLSCNLQHGGGTRIQRIIDAMVAHDADVIALSEFRTKPGELLVLPSQRGLAWSGRAS